MRNAFVSRLLSFKKLLLGTGWLTEIDHGKKGLSKKKIIKTILKNIFFILENFLNGANNHLLKHQEKNLNSKRGVEEINFSGLRKN